MADQFSRTRMLFGEAAMARLRAARVAVFGVGGVGGYAVEALARSGVGALDLIDSDRVSLTNLNRQILALHSTLGQYKVDVAAARVRDINPDCTVRTFSVFFTPENAESFDFSVYDYIVDAIDSVSGKIALAERAADFGVPLIASMGAGNKLDPASFQVTDLFKTSVDPLARVMRRELKKRGIGKLKVVWSPEPPAETSGGEETGEMLPPGKTRVPGSTAFVPAAAGLVLAGAVVRDLIAGAENENR